MITAAILPSLPIERSLMSPTVWLAGFLTFWLRRSDAATSAEGDAGFGVVASCAKAGKARQAKPL
jgi:hypothetical protein